MLHNVCVNLITVQSLCACVFFCQKGVLLCQEINFREWFSFALGKFKLYCKIKINGGKTMVKHIILWKLKEEFNNDDIKNKMKENLEGLLGVVPGLLKIKVQINKLPSSNVDVMLYSAFESEDALAKYAVHPSHVNVADTYVRPYTETRSCIDFEV